MKFFYQNLHAFAFERAWNIMNLLPVFILFLFHIDCGWKSHFALTWWSFQSLRWRWKTPAFDNVVCRADVGRLINNVRVFRFLYICSYCLTVYNWNQQYLPPSIKCCSRTIQHCAFRSNFNSHLMANNSILQSPAYICIFTPTHFLHFFIWYV